MVLIEENIVTTGFGGSNYTLKDKKIATGLDIKLAETDLIGDDTSVGVLTQYRATTPAHSSFKKRDSMLSVFFSGGITITEKQGENTLHHYVEKQNFKCNRMFTSQSYNNIDISYKGGMSATLLDGSVLNVNILITEHDTDKLFIQLIPILTVPNGRNLDENFTGTELKVANTESSPVYNIKLRTSTLKGTPQKFTVPIVPNDTYGEEITVTLSDVKLTLHILQPHKLVKG